ncbi:MAG: hypothetical protein JNM40_22320 [Myxococcales bacterium]|nr:hypothetical protein [Myxococcales bacterium]
MKADSAESGLDNQHSGPSNAGLSVHQGQLLRAEEPAGLRMSFFASPDTADWLRATVKKWLGKYEMRTLFVMFLALLPACWSDCNAVRRGQSLSEKCSGYKQDFDGANLLLEESGYPEKTAAFAWRMYRECMEGK